MELALYKDIETSCNGYILTNNLYRGYPLVEKMINMNYKINQDKPYRIKSNDKFRYKSSLDLCSDSLISKQNDISILQQDKLGKIGIDRFKLYVNIKSINIDIIPNKSSLGIVKNKNGLEVVDGLTGEYIHINKYDYASTENVDILKHKNVRYKIEIQQVQNPSKGISKYESIIDATAPRLLHSMHNIYNVYNKKDIEFVLNTIQYELEEKGICIKLEDATVKEIEINRTFVWDNSIVDEEDILDYVFKVLRKDKSNKNKSKTNKSVRNKEKESFTYSIDTHRMKIKIYTKSEQIINTIGYDCGVHLCRVELTLKRSGISNSYSTNDVNILKDTTKTQDIFLSSMNKKLISPLKKNLTERIVDIERIIKSYDRCNYTTLDLVYKSISKELFDIVLLGIAALNVYEEKGNNNFKRDFQKLLKCVSKNHINRYITLEKLVSSIMGEDIELINIPQKVKLSLKVI